VAGFIEAENRVYDYGYYCEFVKRRFIVEMADEFRKRRNENGSNV